MTAAGAVPNAGALIAVQKVEAEPTAVLVSREVAVDTIASNAALVVMAAVALFWHTPPA